MLPKTSAYVESYDGRTKWMHFFFEDNDSLKKYNTVSNKVSADIEKEVDSKPVYNNKDILRTKIKAYCDEVTDFYDKKIPKVESNHTCLAVITMDSALKKNDNFCPKVFLKECKNVKKRVTRHINNNMSDFSSDDESDEE